LDYPICGYGEDEGLCFIDTDGDGISDPEDNCPDDYNPDQEDADGDGIGDACEGEVSLTVGNGSGNITNSSCMPYENLIEVSLDNPGNKVKGVQVDICDVADYLICTGCEITDRTTGFTCYFNELGDGCARVELFSLTDDLIDKGDGPIFILKFDISEDKDPTNLECIDLSPENAMVSDEDRNALLVNTHSGEFCFYYPCGDVYPQSSCGDGEVNLFDILEEIDIILGIEEASLCQIRNGDVPLGVPPYCGNSFCERDDIINIFDVLVIIDMALGKANCCDLCMFNSMYCG
jgi:hypothetical protein